MRISFFLLVAFVSSVLTGCKHNAELAKQIVEEAKQGKKPSKAEVRIVYEEVMKEGSRISESEVEELLNYHVTLRTESDPAKIGNLRAKAKALSDKL